MIFARLAVYGAIACTLWFNGSYAWSKGGALPHQLSMVALAITIDLCKCGFLPAASRLWGDRSYLPAFLLVVLWLPALAYSTFAGYASITTNRAATSSADQTRADRYSRAQSDYDQASESLTTATASPMWKRSDACTDPRSRRERSFCQSVSDARKRQLEASRQLDTVIHVAVDPEVTVLSETFTWPRHVLSLTVALWPALLLELVASLGLYAVYRLRSGKAPERSSETVSRTVHPKPTKQSESAAMKPAGQSNRKSSAEGQAAPNTLPALTWRR